MIHSFHEDNRPSATISPRHVFVICKTPGHRLAASPLGNRSRAPQVLKVPPSALRGLIDAFKRRRNATIGDFVAEYADSDANRRWCHPGSPVQNRRRRHPEPNANCCRRHLEPNVNRCWHHPESDANRRCRHFRPDADRRWRPPGSEAHSQDRRARAPWRARVSWRSAGACAHSIARSKQAPIAPSCCAQMPRGLCITKAKAAEKAENKGDGGCCSLQEPATSGPTEGSDRKQLGRQGATATAGLALNAKSRPSCA